MDAKIVKQLNPRMGLGFGFWVCAVGDSRRGWILRLRCWRSDFLRARCKYCARCKLPNASLILCCVIGVSLIQLQRQKPKHTWLANSLLPDYQILLTIQPKATPTQTAAITTDSDFNLCTCTLRSHNPSTALSIFSFNASISCFISKMQSSEPPPWPP